MPSIATERLLLRPLRESDRELLAHVHVDAGGSREDAELELDAALGHAAEHGFGHLVVETRAAQEPVGIVELHHAGEGLVGIEPGEIEIGWIVLRARRGRGFATEAAAAAADHAFLVLGLDRLVAYVRPVNRASLRVVEKLGMAPRGRGRSRSGAVVEIFELAAEPGARTDA